MKNNKQNSSSIDESEMKPKAKGLSLIKTILNANGIQLEPTQRCYRTIQIPSLLDDIIVKYRADDNDNDDLEI